MVRRHSQHGQADRFGLEQLEQGIVVEHHLGRRALDHCLLVGFEFQISSLFQPVEGLPDWSATAFELLGHSGLLDMLAWAQLCEHNLVA